MSNDLNTYNSTFPMDYSPLSNYLQYNIMNREIYSNWCSAFATPVLYKKLKKEGVNLDPSSTETDFSKIDKYVIAYGKQASIFNDEESYLYYESYLPIQPESFEKLNNAFDDNLQIDAPFDERFSYGIGDLVIFKFNEYIFRFNVDAEPESFSGVLFKLNLKYVDKISVIDLNQLQSNPERIDVNEYW